MKPIHLIVRNAWSHVLNCIPLSCFESLRHQQASLPGHALRKRVARALLSAVRYRSLSDAPTDFAIEPTSSIRLINDGSQISRCVYWLGLSGHEPTVAKWWSACCSRAHGILEIGANIGYMTVRGAASAGSEISYTAVEPNPDALSSLRCNLKLNTLDHVRVVESAVVGHVTSPTLAFCVSTLDPYTAPTGSHLASVEAPAAHERVVEVPVTAINTLLDGVDLVKLDVEGAELDILTAAQTRLAAQRAILFVEVLDAAQELRQFLAAFATEHAYRLLILCDPLIEVTPAELPSLALWKRYRSRDLLVLPVERVDEMPGLFVCA